MIAICRLCKHFSKLHSIAAQRFNVFSSMLQFYFHIVYTWCLVCSVVERLEADLRSLRFARFQGQPSQILNPKLRHHQSPKWIYTHPGSFPTTQDSYLATLPGHLPIVGLGLSLALCGISRAELIVECNRRSWEKGETTLERRGSPSHPKLWAFMPYQCSSVA